MGRRGLAAHGRASWDFKCQEARLDAPSDRHIPGVGYTLNRVLRSAAVSKFRACLLDVVLCMSRSVDNLFSAGVFGFRVCLMLVVLSHFAQRGPSLKNHKPALGYALIARYTTASFRPPCKDSAFASRCLLWILRWTGGKGSAWPP